ncbi:MAG: hypothetical protein WKG07_33450 [Hymenobacter sp.]
MATVTVKGNTDADDSVRALGRRRQGGGRSGGKQGVHLRGADAASCPAAAATPPSWRPFRRPPAILRWPCATRWKAAFSSASR